MTSTIERDFIVKNGVASFPMKEYPNYCGIENIGYISHGEWSDAELEYKHLIICPKDCRAVIEECVRKMQLIIWKKRMINLMK